MSSDNGTILTNHPCGGYALVGYFSSNDGPIVAREDNPRYKTIEEAVFAYEKLATEFEEQTGMPYDEYGLSIRVTETMHRNRRPIVEHRTCARCGVRKPLQTDFSRSVKNKSGYIGICKTCESRQE